jgi:outer membrane protein TolC
VTFDEAIARALEKNPSVAIAATNILRSEALLLQARAQTMPRVGVSATNTTLDTGREFGGQTVQPQNQTVLGLNAALPVAPSQWALKAQALDQVGIARLSVTDTRRQIAGGHRLRVSGDHRAEAPGRGQPQRDRDGAQPARIQHAAPRGRRRQPVERAALVATGVVERSGLEVLRFAVRRSQEALGVLLAANGPVDVSGEPAFEIPQETAEAEWLPNRPDIKVLVAERDANERVVNDSKKDWWPIAAVTFGPQLLTPAGLFQASRTWAFSMQVSQPLFEGGQRKGLRRQRESVFEASRLSLEQLQIEARSEVRIARAAIESRERALVSARQAAQTANEVLKITIVAFDAGSTTNIEVIDAQRSARDLELVVVQAEDAVRQARLDLLVALGMFPK